MTFGRPHRSPPLPRFRLQHKALVEDAKYLKAEAIRGKKKTNKNKANREETKQHKPDGRLQSLPYLFELHSVVS